MHRAPLTNHHADGTNCPKEHKHNSSGKPLHPDCPGREYSQAICSCGRWEMKQSCKGYVLECRKRHLGTHRAPDDPASPPVRDVLPFSMR